MAIFDFLWKKVKYYTDASVQNAVSGISECLAEINERLRKIETRQKETSIQLEEIDSFLQDGGNETELINTLITLADIIGDFYYFAAADPNSPLFGQASMMWNKTKNAVEAVGLEIIDANNEPFDFHLHSAENAEQDVNIPNGYVIKTLKFGYMHQNEILRRAAVIINKIEKTDNEIDTPKKDNIIYL